jgi:hypothetical protein
VVEMLFAMCHCDGTQQLRTILNLTNFSTTLVLVFQVLKATQLAKRIWQFVLEMFLICDIIRATRQHPKATYGLGYVQ